MVPQDGRGPRARSLSHDIVEQLASADIPCVDLVLSTAKTAEKVSWIAQVLRPFGHLSVVDVDASLDVSPLVLKAASVHTEIGVQPNHE